MLFKIKSLSYSFKYQFILLSLPQFYTNSVSPSHLFYKPSCCSQTTKYTLTSNPVFKKYSQTLTANWKQLEKLTIHLLINLIAILQIIRFTLYIVTNQCNASKVLNNIFYLKKNII